MDAERDESTAFSNLLNKLARVPKREIDEQQRKEDRHPSEPAKPGQIASIPKRKSR